MQFPGCFLYDVNSEFLGGGRSRRRVSRILIDLVLIEVFLLN